MGWHRTGSEACYFKNQVTRAGVTPYWTLTFVIGAMFEQDTLYLAHCFPYRYVLFGGSVLGREGGDDTRDRMWSVLYVPWVVRVEMVHLAGCGHACTIGNS